MERDHDVEMVKSCLCAMVLARAEDSDISGRRPGHDNI